MPVLSQCIDFDRFLMSLRIPVFICLHRDEFQSFLSLLILASGFFVPAAQVQLPLKSLYSYFNGSLWGITVNWYLATCGTFFAKLFPHRRFDKFYATLDRNKRAINRHKKMLILKIRIISPPFPLAEKKKKKTTLTAALDSQFSL